MTEKEIIQGCIDQDRRSQNALYKLYFPLMSSIGLRYTQSKDEALQGLNFGFLKVLQNIEKYNAEFALATWIRNIMVRHFIDELRKNKSRLLLIVNVDTNDEKCQLNLNEGEEKMDADYLREVLNKLDEPMKAIFCMHAIDGFKHKEIAKKFEITEGTSRWYVNKARTILKNKLEENQTYESQQMNRRAR